VGVGPYGSDSLAQALGSQVSLLFAWFRKSPAPRTIRFGLFRLNC